MTNGNGPVNGQQATLGGLSPSRPNGRSAAGSSPALLPDAAAVHLISFSYGSGPPPGADITLDLRRQFGSPAGLEPDDLTGPPLCEACGHMPPEADGIPELIEDIVPVVTALRSGNGPGCGPATLAVGCADGRVSATVVTAMHRRMNRQGRVTVEHLPHEPEPGPSALEAPPAPPQSAGADGPRQ